MRRGLWLSLGLAALILASLGAALPLLPTTPFLLVAAYAFARSSPRLHDWLISHRLFGPLIRNWQEHGAISRRAKALAVLSMIAVLGLSAAVGLPLVVILVQAAVLSAVAAFLLSRPSGPWER